MLVPWRNGFAVTGRRPDIWRSHIRGRKTKSSEVVKLNERGVAEMVIGETHEGKGTIRLR